MLQGRINQTEAKTKSTFLRSFHTGAFFLKFHLPDSILPPKSLINLGGIKMLKVKKIMEKVLPQASLVTPEEAKEVAVKNAAKPIIFEERRNYSHVRCMACDSVFSIATMKEI